MSEVSRGQFGIKVPTKKVEALAWKGASRRNKNAEETWEAGVVEDEKRARLCRLWKGLYNPCLIYQL